jgi:hypothetical protein
VTIAVVGGIQSPYGAIVGALAFYFLPALSAGGTPSPWLTPLFGVGAVLLARRPGGLVGLVSERWPQRLVAVRTRPPGAPGGSAPRSAPVPAGAGGRAGAGDA